MHKKVVIFECDNHCGAIDKPEGPEDGIARLPKNWTQLTSVTNAGEQFHLDLCPKCMIAVGNALGARQNETRK